VLHRLQDAVQTQALEDIAVNIPERKVLSTVISHLKRSWQVALGVAPSDNDIRQLLALIRIHVLDVDAGGAAEQEAKDRLRASVLRNPGQADTAWARLIEACAQWAAEQSGANRHSLQQVLLDVGINIQAPRSYRDNIERLTTHAQRTSDILSHLARIRLGTTEIKIHRLSTVALRCAAEEGSLLVVGDPGAGKSGALCDLVRLLREEERDVIFLAVDRLAASSTEALRVELGLDRDLTEVLANWPGTAPAFLVIDALDAVRADPAANAIRDLIQTVIGQCSRWHVVASIRKFDLQYSQELKQLFSGNLSNTFQDQDLLTVRHLKIPQLSMEELAQILSQSPPLQTVIDNAPEALRELLRVLFNVRLMAELLGAGIDPADLSPIRTQLELLDRYWLYRVVCNDRQRDAREGVLRRACDQMVRTRALRVDRRSIADPAVSPHLDYLLSTQILTEWRASSSAAPEQYVLTFSHHVLFDYAVARLLFRGTPEALVTRLTDDPEQVIVVRPSLLLHFRHLWNVDPHREPFWFLVFQIIQADRIPEIGKLIGPAVAAELASELADLDPLYIHIGSLNRTTRAIAEQALRHLVGSLLVATPGERSLVGPGAGPWCDLLEYISQNLREPVAYTVRPLLVTVCEHPDAFTPQQRTAAGRTARRLLEYAWTMAIRDSWLVGYALQSVCRTFEGDSTASAALLRRSLEPAHLAEHGYEEMPRLAREVRRLISVDTDLVGDIYQAVFRYQERRTDSIPLGSSRIVPMTSNIQQDYHMALYELAKVFSDFLTCAPRRATSTLLAVIEAYVSQAHSFASDASDEATEESFLFNGIAARICADYSCIWDEGDVYRNDLPVQMLDNFERYLESLAEREEDAVQLHELVELLAKENRLAVFWRRLLHLAARFPKTLGREILPLAWAVPILKGIDTSALAGDFLKVIFPDLSPDVRERVEQALLSIPNAVPIDDREAAEHMRNRLLGCLTVTLLVTDEARHLLAALQAANAVPPNEPPIRSGGWTSTPYTEEDDLVHQGVPIGTEPNRKVSDFEQPVKAFASKHPNSVPPPEQVAAILPALQALHTALSHADAEGVHPTLQDYAWGHLAAACCLIAKTERLSCDNPAGSLARTILLEASRHPDPRHHPEDDARFDEHPSWGSPATRIEAAQGLMLLARQASCATPEVLQAIKQLSTDPVPAVRFQIAAQLNMLYRTAPELMWQIIDHLCLEERSRGVLQWLLNGTLHHLAGAYPDLITNFTKEIFDRVREGPGARRVRALCVGVFTSLYIWRDNVRCRETIFGVVAAAVTHPDDAHAVLHHLRQPLTHGPTESPNPEQDAIRQRTFDLVARLLHVTRDGLHHIQNKHQNVPFNSWPAVAQESARSLTQLIDSIGDELYFASGAFDGMADQKPLTHDERARFYDEAGHIIDDLADMGLASLTHHLLEILESFIPFNPSSVFRRIGRVILAGKKGNYQYESLAADLMVRLVERYLAEYRSLLREDEECRRILFEVLDVFVQAGWPSARRLTYRLEEIFR
jgi:hypothetical protein